MAEFIILFFLVPFYYAFHHEMSPIMFLFVLGGCGIFYLYRSPDFRNDVFINPASFLKDLPRILIIFIFTALVLTGLTRLFLKEYLFYCPSHHFRIWLSIMVIYPLLSVYPQELIYRAFIFHRYKAMLPGKNAIVHLSAIAFSFGHVIYFHPLSIILTFFGGYLFAWTYVRTRSLLAVSVEHALYGCLLYTIGLGRFFYTGFDKILS